MEWIKCPDEFGKLIYIKFNLAVLHFLLVLLTSLVFFQQGKTLQFSGAPLARLTSWMLIVHTLVLTWLSAAWLEGSVSSVRSMLGSSAGKMESALTSRTQTKVGNHRILWVKHFYILWWPIFYDLLLTETVQITNNNDLISLLIMLTT